MNEINIDEIIKLDSPSTGYNLIEIKSDKFIGKSSENKYVFVSKSQTSHSSKSVSKKLSISTAVECLIDNEKNTYDILTCHSDKISEIETFIRLTYSISFDNTNIESFFITLNELLDDNTQSTHSIQGLFTELYAIKYLDECGIDISPYWHTNNSMKFDFYLNNNKYIEIKSTKKEERKHLFSYEQLNDFPNTTLVISIMLRKSNIGISLEEMINYGRKKYSENSRCLLIIEKTIKNLSKFEYEEYIYDKIYMEKNIAFYLAKDIPRFIEPQPNGVIHTKFESNLSIAEKISFDSFFK